MTADTDLDTWVQDLRAEVDATRDELRVARELLGDPDVAEVARALEAAAVAYGPVRVVELAGQCPDEDCFGVHVDGALAGFWRALAAAAIGAMADSMPERALSMPVAALEGPAHALPCPEDSGPATAVSGGSEREGVA